MIRSSQRDSCAQKTKAKSNYGPRSTRKWQKVAGPVSRLWWANKCCGTRQPCSLRKAESKSQGAAQPARLCSWMTYSATPVGTQRRSALGNAPCLATSSLGKQVNESHINNWSGGYFYRRNLFWSNWIFALWCINSQRDSIFFSKFLLFMFLKGHLTEIFWYSFINDLTHFFWITLMKLNENIFSPIPDHAKLSIWIYCSTYFGMQNLHGEKEVFAFLSALLNHKTTIKLQKVNEVQTCLSDSKVGKMSIAVT